MPIHLWKKRNLPLCGICSYPLLIKQTSCLLCEKRYHDKCLSGWISLNEDAVPACPCCLGRVGRRGTLPQTELERDERLEM